jgi:hypothetical protein
MGIKAKRSFQMVPNGEVPWRGWIQDIGQLVS